MTHLNIPGLLNGKNYLMAEILLTGGSGLLGKELQRCLRVDAPTHKDFDILNLPERRNCGLIIHAAAYTGVAKAEIDRRQCFDTNVLGTARLVEMYRDTPFVYISTEYARNPVNYYGRTKRLAEDIVRELPQHLIIRTLFKPRPYPWDVAFVDQFTQGDYVDVIARQIADEVTSWSGVSQTIYVGTGRKTMFDLAKETKPDVKPNSIKDIKNVIIPADYE